MAVSTAAFDKMAESLQEMMARHVTWTTAEAAKAVLSDFLDENTQVFTTFDQLHPGVARDPEFAKVLEERIRREVALATMPAVHVYEDGTTRDNNWDAKVWRGSLIVLGGAK